MGHPRWAERGESGGKSSRLGPTGGVGQETGIMTAPVPCAISELRQNLRPNPKPNISGSSDTEVMTGSGSRSALYVASR